MKPRNMMDARLFRPANISSFSLCVLLAVCTGLLPACSGTNDSSSELDRSFGRATSEAPNSNGGEDSLSGATRGLATTKAMDSETGQPVSASSGSGSAKPQDQVSLADQKRKYLVEESLKKARDAQKLKLWKDVLKAAGGVLQLDPRNDEARKLLREAQAYVDESAGGGIDIERFRADMQGRLQKEKDLAQADKFLRLGEAALAENEFEEARKAFERAILTLKYSPWFQPENETQRKLEALLVQTETDRKEWEKKASDAEKRATRAALRAAENEDARQRQAIVRRLFEEANLAFQNKRYGHSISLLNRALLSDPLNSNAKSLRDLAMRARHDSKIMNIELKWKEMWKDTFVELETMDLPQAKIIDMDPAHWITVESRTPVQFTTAELGEDPTDLAIMKVLEDSYAELNFTEETAIDDWVKFYQKHTGVNFLISAKVKELDEESTSLSDFKLGRKSVRAGLDLIARLKPLKWLVRDGIVWILTPEESKGETVPQMYDVREIVNPLTSHPGKDLQQTVGDIDDGGLDDIDPVPIVVDIDKLQELIKANIASESWDGENVGIQATGSSGLIITQTPEVHRQIDHLLRDLRRSSGIQVNIQTRFLSVEDNFLEEVGIDFRGLGDNASAGKPGLGLQKQGNRAGFGFNDFGQNAAISDEGSVGSGFEPGIFYDDGKDGDLIARTENLFDRALGGGVDGLTNAGGFSLQYTYLDDTEVETILRAVAKQERVLQLSAPQLLVHNTARANLTVTNQFTYIRDFNVEIAQAAAVADPVVDVIRDGIVLDVRPVVTADRRFILLELRPTLARLTLPIPTFTTTLGIGQQISIQLPELLLQKVRTTVTIPDGGTLLLGGMKNVQKQQFDSGIPILKDIPLLSFFFSRKGTFRSYKKILILLNAKIIVPQEHEPVTYRRN